MSNYERTVARQRKRTSAGKLPPKYIATAHLGKEQRRSLQQQRDQARVAARKQYEARLAEIDQQYWRAVMAQVDRKAA